MTENCWSVRQTIVLLLLIGEIPIRQTYFVLNLIFTTFAIWLNLVTMI